MLETKTRIAVIGGTILEERFTEGTSTRIGTPYGPSPVLRLATVGSKDIVFMPRHGEKHTLPPHQINYRANIWSLHLLGVERILATNAVGSLNSEIKPEEMVLPSDFIDFTHLRSSTFYDEAPVTHVDSNVYCPELRRIIYENAIRERSTVHEKGTYLCTEGPRYQSTAETQMFRSWGCDVVGMTGLPEAILAHELGICYGSLCYVTHMETGNGAHLSTEQITSEAKKSSEQILGILLRSIEAVPRKRNCHCSESLEGARV